ncbi:MAG: dihydrolipoyl dehydrogenase [Burkholderiales bacterium]|jgi:dihydrolipoamide dehydrogenase|nr:MAG: dihydrolipoyl dehydrogenase [Burkholderiales bacterium]
MDEAILDVVVIGAGTAGLAALREIRKRSERFALIDDGKWGTTCARVGCMPSKALIESANAFHRRRDFDVFGIRGAESLRADVPAVLVRVRALRDQFVSGVRKLTDGLGERAITGRARIVAPDCVEVNGRRLRARRIIVATGSEPVVPPPWRALGERLLTTDNLFERDDLPARIAVVGMGAIGAEVAQALSRLGIEVTAFGSSELVAGLSDPQVNAALLASLRQEFPVHVGAPAVVSAADDGSVRVSNGRQQVQADAVLAALGRRPVLAGLGLDTLGVPLDENGLPSVDPTTMRVGASQVFLVGDANAQAPLQHEAADEGHIAGLIASGAVARRFRRRVPLSIVFCDPDVAVVGRRFSQLDGSDVLVGEYRFERQGRARIEQRARGVLRVYAARGIGLLLGAELCAPAGAHLAHLLALAMERTLTVHDLLRMPFYHPVLEEGLRSALRELASQLPPCSESDLAGCGPIGADAIE